MKTFSIDLSDSRPIIIFKFDNYRFPLDSLELFPPPYSTLPIIIISPRKYVSPVKQAHRVLRSTLNSSRSPRTQQALDKHRRVLMRDVGVVDAQLALQVASHRVDKVRHREEDCVFGSATHRGDRYVVGTEARDHVQQL